MRFTRLVTNIEGAPPAWIAVARPFTFVITEYRPGMYAASANDTRQPVVASDKIGNDFTTFEAAQVACRNFLVRHRQ